MKALRYAPAALICFMAVFPAHAGLVIEPIFDRSITNDPNATAIENTIDAAINTYETLFTNPITVVIYFQEDSSGLGANISPRFAGSYGVFYNQLAATNANPAALAALNAYGGNGSINPVTHNSGITASSANLRAIGIGEPADCYVSTTGQSSFPNQCNSVAQSSGIPTYTSNDPSFTGTQDPNVDGIVGFTVSNEYTLGNYNSLEYGMEGTLEHEIDEVLGLGSAFPNTNCSGCAETLTYTTMECYTCYFNVPEPEDLFRWNGNGTRQTSLDCTQGAPAYFSYGPSTGNIARFATLCQGEDFGDWSTGSSPQTQDANATQGANPLLGTAEIDALTAIGYTEVPEPGTAALLLSVLAALAIARSRTA